MNSQNRSRGPRQVQPPVRRAFAVVRMTAKLEIAMATKISGRPNRYHTHFPLSMASHTRSAIMNTAAPSSTKLTRNAHHVRESLLFVAGDAGAWELPEGGMLSAIALCPPNLPLNDKDKLPRPPARPSCRAEPIWRSRSASSVGSALSRIAAELAKAQPVEAGCFDGCTEFLGHNVVAAFTTNRKEMASRHGPFGKDVLVNVYYSTVIESVNARLL